MERVFTLKTPPLFSLRRSICSYGFFALPPNDWKDGKFRRPLSLGNSSYCYIEIEEVPASSSSSLDFVSVAGNEQELNKGATKEQAAGVTLKVKVQIPGDNNKKDDDNNNHTNPDDSPYQAILNQVKRMLRLDLDLSVWFKICPKAKREKFGWLFRSPSLFEDMVKTICTCNTNWKRTTRMCLQLCHIPTNSHLVGAFPIPEDIVKLSVNELKEMAGLGYRAHWVME